MIIRVTMQFHEGAGGGDICVAHFPHKVNILILFY